LRAPANLLRVVALTALTAVILLPAPAAAGDQTVAGTDKLRAVEATLLKDINHIRVQNGRKPLRVDVHTSSVARARSSDMAAKRYFSHTEPDGDDADRILRRRGIKVSEVTENIGHTFGLTLKQGSNRMASWWYHSPPHRKQMLARDINYVGIGIARRGSRFAYTAIFTRSADKTSPRVAINETGWRLGETGLEVTIDWQGIDPKLAKGTAGIKRFEVEHLRPLQGWSQVEGNPRASKRSTPTIGSGDQRIRIRAIDKAGNLGPWTYTRVDIPDELPRWV
jgi:uncharacterized protein YkwD